MKYHIIKLKPELYWKLREYGEKHYGKTLSTPFIVYLMLRDLKRK